MAALRARGVLERARGRVPQREGGGRGGKSTSVARGAAVGAAGGRSGLPRAELIRGGIGGPPARPVVVPLRPREIPKQPAGVVPADAGESAQAAAAPDGRAEPPGCRPRCPQCAWRAIQPVRLGEPTSCESCGSSFVAEEER